MGGLITIALCEIPDGLPRVADLSFMKKVNLFKGVRSGNVTPNQYSVVPTTSPSIEFSETNSIPKSSMYKREY